MREKASPAPGAGPTAAWVAFFKEAHHLAALARERRAARESEQQQGTPRT